MDLRVVIEKKDIESARNAVRDNKVNAKSSTDGQRRKKEYFWRTNRESQYSEMEVKRRRGLMNDNETTILSR